MMQTGTVGSITDVHAGAFAHGFESFQNLNGRRAVLVLRRIGIVCWVRGHGLLSLKTIATRKQNVLHAAGNSLP